MTDATANTRIQRSPEHLEEVIAKEFLAPTRGSRAFRIPLALMAVAVLVRVVAGQAEDLGLIERLTEEIWDGLATLAFTGSLLLVMVEFLELGGLKWLLGLTFLFMLVSTALKAADDVAGLNTVPILGNDSSFNNFFERFCQAAALFCFFLGFVLATVRLRRTNSLLWDEKVRLAREIARNRSTESALVESEARFRNLMEFIPGVSIQGYTTDGTVVYWNRASKDVYGYSPEEAVGRNLADLIVPPGLKPLFEQCLEVAKSVKESGEFMPPGELELLHKDGHLVPVYSIHTAVCVDGNDPVLFCIDLDLEERKRAEEALAFSEDRFRSMVQKSSDAFFIVATDGTIRYASPAAQRIMGYAPEQELLGRNGLELVHPDDLPLAKQRLADLVEDPANDAPFELRVRHKDGTWLTFEIRGTNLFDNPAIEGIVITGRDVTDRKSLEDQVRQSQKMEAMGTLAGGIAHDFNNLLTGVLLHSELGRVRTADDPELRDHFDQIHKAGRLATGLTRQLLEFSRRQPNQPKQVSLNTLISDTESLLRRLIGEDITLVSALSADPDCVHADPTHLEQIVLNLAVNARDAMPQGGKLTLETGNIELRPGARGVGLAKSVAAGHYVRLKVTDTGCGMDAATQAHIFEPFFTTKEHGKGTGLGLSTVYGNVNASGGHIAVRSEKGRGTTFEVLFPQVEALPEEPKISDEPEVIPLNDRETLLITEDDAEVRRLAARILRQQGYIVLEAESAAAALDRSHSHKGRIDLLVTDVIMSGMCGPALAEEIRAERPDLRVLYVSGHTQDRMAAYGIPAAESALLEKPFTSKDLAAKVQEVLTRAQHSAAEASTPLGFSASSSGGARAIRA